MLFDPLWRDVRYACRSLKKAPAYTATAVLTLALGIGANTAIFSALDGIVLQPLPYDDPDRLLQVALYNLSLKYATAASYPDFLDWQRDARSFEQIAAFTWSGFDLTSPGSPEHIAGYEVSAGFFSTLGVKLAIGRSFSSTEDRTGGTPVAIISHRLWQERFQGRTSVLGKPLTLDGSGYTIVGVLPPGFRFEDQVVDIFTPIGRGNPLFRSDRTVHDVLCVARLAPGVTLGQAQAEMDTVQRHINELNPATEKGQTTSLVPLKQVLVGDIRGTLLLLLGAVGVVLLIACTNVANLLLARSAVRTRDFAVRRALGASRAQIMRQTITESVLLSCAGGVLGVALARFGLSIAPAALSLHLPRVENIRVNASVLLFALAVSVAVGVLFALLPALKQSGADLHASMRQSGRGATSRHERMQGVLAMAQVALAVVLLCGAGLLFRTIRNLSQVNPGFETRHIITFQVGLSPSLTGTASATRAAYQQLTDRIRHIPGIESAALTALVPLGPNDNSGPFWIGARPPRSMAEIPRALYYPTGPEYPATMRIPLLRGRYLTRADNIHSELVVLVDDLLARTYFRNSDAVGQSLTIPHWGADSAVPARIAGVVGHVEQYGIDGSAGEKPQIYYSLYQLPDEGLPIFRNEVTFVARTRVKVGALIPELKIAVNGVSRDEPIYNVRTMRDLVAGSMSRQRFPMILLVAFAILALALATIGTYGVIAYFTSQRIPEIGIRLALGATKSDVVQMFVARGLRLALSGIVLGAVAALVLTNVLSSFSRLLYGVSATDPFTFAEVSACLIVAVVLACYFPARRAASVDAMTALRHD